jgi:hypothetical protein
MSFIDISPFGGFVFAANQSHARVQLVRDLEHLFNFPSATSTRILARAVRPRRSWQRDA